jgi:ribosome-binding ATPase YchF (GTP1/OBG family)
VILGLLGKPNVGKSSFFHAATLKDVEVANYPFTTIEPNVGVAHASLPCPSSECRPSRGACVGGRRFVPVRLYDVAGLVPGAHQGKGLGNRFLADASRGDVLIMVVDASGRTDEQGNQAQGNPVSDVEFVMDEFDRWLAGIVRGQLEKRRGSVETLKTELSGLGISAGDVDEAMSRASPGGDCLAFASELRKAAKPAIIAANQADRPEAREWLGRLEKTGYPVVPTSAAYETALRKAAASGFIEYVPGAGDFRVVKDLGGQQEAALERIREFLGEFGSTGVQEVIDRATFGLAGMIAVFPVEDEGKWSDSRGNVLPDCLLVPKGTTAREFAYRIHTDIGEGFVKAVDARTHRAVGADAELSHGDIIKVFSRS